MEKIPDFHPPVFKDNTLNRKTGAWREKSQTPIILKESETVSTCIIACPIHQDIRGWLVALKDNEIKKTAKKMLRHNPLASSVSRVCPVFCEKGCKYFRQGFDEPIAINCVEKFIGDWILTQGYSIKAPKIRNKKKIAVVGSGPAGLTCAYLLRQRGYAVSVFEKNYVLGGLLRTGIPEDRLPKNIIFGEIDLILQAGVEFRGGYEVNETNFLDLKKEFQAIFLAPGFSEGKKLNIPGAELDEAISALDFLKQINLGEITDLSGKTVIVIGAGNTAMDSARMAKKLGARTIVAYRRKKENIKAFGNEIEETERAGAEFHFEMTPLKIVKNVPRGLLTEFQNNDLKVILGCDLVVMAVGQQKSPFFEKMLQEKTTEDLEMEGIFIGGDLLSGPKTVAHAIGTGKDGAKKIAAFLKNKNYLRKMRLKIGRQNINPVYFTPKKRIGTNAKPNLEQIIEEAKRCFSCGLCRSDKCWEGIGKKGSSCHDFCPEFSVEKSADGKSLQKINYDYCKGCGICVKECPRGVIALPKEEKK